ncbi:MAG: TetR/AcrR family transcriptional regulator [Bacteroidetes bacterium]|nr:TetR/AcrR family transcriptional regulator [Bacteroidota bacterium]
MKSTIDQPWIETGYSLFSRDGLSGLKIDLIAKKIGISRSSFYHHFADMEIFQEKLLEYHLTRAQRASERVKACKTMDPEFLHAMVEEKNIYYLIVISVITDKFRIIKQVLKLQSE